MVTAPPRLDKHGVVNPALALANRHNDAWRRGYADAAPVKGVIRVSGAHTLKATVDVVELEPE